MSRIEPLSRQWLDVGDGHLLHLVEYGKPQGIPLLFLHGGPGAGCHISDLELFDLQRFRVLLLDQRGAGKSQPSGRLVHNDVLSLLTDIERLRQWLGLERWCLAGGSFGATLGLIYSGLCPQRVLGQCYWGIFVPSAAGRSWLYGSQGAAKRFPVDYRGWRDAVSANDEDTLLQAFAQALQRSELKTVAAWCHWERTLAHPWTLLPTEYSLADRSCALIENHFARHHYFDAYVLLKATMDSWPTHTWLLQGEQDWVCPPFLLKQMLAEQTQPTALQLVAGGHHSLMEPRMQQAVIAAVREMADNVAQLANTGVIA
ncbi:alpha/beta fold hydrolase [Shewanella yunxiaonensis]|uniref:Proline iminopeptidase n=1 Tax=Shewanella yunxiaonensis TaxID=2829809 RepID=A0ABX7YSM3_9GAMM|nr:MULTISPECIES: alpha/beta fold hydrolase [Shewanella]MDF0533338.1 alpha/beta fold hydrolase [Shewanella sp. A32]QUN05727.1 alpha/beta fold hydrolase [Shewanella yunxiaonensis]